MTGVRTRAPVRVQSALGVAGSFDCLSFVYFRKGDLGDWGNSRKAAKSVDAAFAAAGQWIARYRPKLVIVPAYGEKSRKGKHTRALIEAVAAAADAAKTPCVRVERPRNFPNKHKQAAALANAFPQIAPLAPRRRRAWEIEPHNTLLFEALAIAYAHLRRRS